MCASFTMKDPRAARLALFFITVPEWNLIDAYQNHICAICKQPNKSGQRLSTDHSHITGLLRGLLCQRCNRILGKIEQKRFWGSADVSVTIRLLRSAADFLEHPTAPIALGREIYTFPGKFGTQVHKDWLRKNRGVMRASFTGDIQDETIRTGIIPRKRTQTRRRKVAANGVS